MGTREAPYAPVRGFFLGGFGERRLGVSVRTKIAVTSARQLFTGRVQLCPRRFPPPWTAERIPAGYVVKDATGQALAYVYGSAEPQLRLPDRSGRAPRSL